MVDRTPTEAAGAARHRLGIGVDGPVPDLLHLLEDRAGLAVFIVPLPREGVDGAYMVDRDRPFVLVNQNGHPVKKRFTLAHEFGHHFLEHGPQSDASVNPDGARSAVEREANEFASALLMPRTAVDLWFGANGDPVVGLDALVGMAYFFNVSAPAALVRLSTLGRLPSANALPRLRKDIRDKRHTARARALGLEYPVDSLVAEHQAGGHVPTRSQRKIAEAVVRGLIDEGAAEQLMHIPLERTRERLRQLASDDDTDA